MLAMLWTAAVPIVTSLSTVALYAAYVIPVALGLRARRMGSSWARNLEWSLGKYGTALNAIAVCYAAFIVVILVMPPNQLAGWTMLGTTALLGILYVALIRRKYRGPAWHTKDGAIARP
jgi:hypothetical protein